MAHDNLADRIVQLEEQVAALRSVAEHAERMIPEAIEVLKRHDYVFRRFPRNMREQPPVGEEERWEALAFSLYSRIGEVSSLAVRALNDCDEATTVDAVREDVR